MSYSIRPTAPDISIYLTGELRSPEHYLNAFELLRQASPTTRVTIYLNGPGGNAETCIQFVSAIRACPGTVVGVLDGIAMSAHAVILMACHGIIVNQFTQFMAHHASFASWDQGEKTIENAIMKENWLFGMVSHFFGPLLSEDELTELRSGVRDKYFDAEEFAARLHRWGVGNKSTDGVYTFTRFDYLGYTEEQIAEYINSVYGNEEGSEESVMSKLANLMGGTK